MEQSYSSSDTIRVNVLLLGQPHSGKSSLINTFDHLYGGAQIPECPTGRNANRGTTKYEGYIVEKRDKSPICIDTGKENLLIEKFTFFDTAGRQFRKKLSEGDVSLVAALLKGMATGVDLVGVQGNGVTSWVTEKVPCKQNTIDAAFIIVSAVKLLERKTETFNYVLYKSTRTTFIVSLEEIAFVQTMVDLLEKLQGHLPTIIVTGMDEFKDKIIKQAKENNSADPEKEHTEVETELKTALKGIAHGNLTCFVSTWEPPERDLSASDRKTLEFIMKQALLQKRRKARK